MFLLSYFPAAGLKAARPPLSVCGVGKPVRERGKRKEEKVDFGTRNSGIRRPVQRAAWHFNPGSILPREGAAITILVKGCVGGVGAPPAASHPLHCLPPSHGCRGAVTSHCPRFEPTYEVLQLHSTAACSSHPWWAGCSHVCMYCHQPAHTHPAPPAPPPLHHPGGSRFLSIWHMPGAHYITAMQQWGSGE